MSKEITITREQFKEVASLAISKGDLINKAIEKDAHMAFTMMLMSVPMIADIEDALFGKEEDN